MRVVLVWCAAALVAAGCSQAVGGTATRPVPSVDERSQSPVDVEAVILDTTQMRAITGAGDDLTVVPTMDAKVPVDIEALASGTPAGCKWVFRETETFGPEYEDFRKTTFQHPPERGLISEAAAAYRDAGTARRVFDGLTEQVKDCRADDLGRTLVGDWEAGPDELSTTLSNCGREYRVKGPVVVEVTFCGFPRSVPEIVAANILAKVPG